MSGKLDQSLDEIMKDRKPAGGKRAGRLPNRRAAAKSKAATTAVIAPTGGVQKARKQQPSKAAPKAPTALAVQATGESKISVSNLPDDVNEQMIKDYFSSMVAPVKRVILNYGPNNRSRGSATVIFGRPTAAAEAAKLDNTKVDNRNMRIEVIMNAKSVPAPQAPKSLKDRTTAPKNAAKENEKKKGKQQTPKTTAATNGAAKEPKAGKKKSGRAGRPKAKTAEELDAEMQDYFGGGEAATTNGAAAPAAATNGVDTMDEVM